MSRIRFPDKDNPTWEMTYYGDDNQRKIKSFKEKDGTLTTYKYSSDPKDNHDIVELEIRKKSSSGVSKETHEFFYKMKASGEKWTWREVETVDGASTDRQNDENCGCPRLIKTKAGQASFDYDSKGRVIKRETPSEITELRWDDTVGKVLYAEKRQKLSPAKPVSATFVYDAKGNLTSAESSDGKRVKLVYDSNGRISKLTYFKAQIEFAYNNDSQPKTIRVIGVATLTVEYDSSGEVKTVKSEPLQKGEDAALQVSNAFDELLAITTIAKVKFSL
jgi:YD repeat-containing protein